MWGEVYSSRRETNIIFISNAAENIVLNKKQGDKHMKKFIRKNVRAVVAVMLAVCLLLENSMSMAYAGPQADIQAAKEKTSGEGVESAAAEEPYPVCEIEEKRDEYTKYFRMSDGTTMAASYREKVHSYENGKYEEINASLTESVQDGEQVIGNELGSLAVKFAKKSGNNKLVTIGKGNSKIKISLNGALKTDAVKLEDNIPAPEGLDKRLIVNTKSGVIYKDILKNTDIAYVGSAEQLKENIILKKKDVPESFTFTNKGSGKLGYRRTDEGNIEIFLQKSPENVIYIMEKPFMADAAGNYSSNVEMNVGFSANGLEVTVVPDRKFLESKDTVYPVVIDPPVSTPDDYEAISDTFVAESTPNDSSVGKYGSLLIGRNHAYERCRAYIKFNSLPQLSAGDVVVKAYFSLWQYDFSAEGTQEFYISAYKNTGDWNENVTWNTRPGYSDAVDYTLIGPAKTDSGNLCYYQRVLDITKLVRDWYSTGNNMGVMLASNEENRYAVARFFTSDYPFGASGRLQGSSEQYPSGIFIYRSTCGIEDYWSYHSASTTFGAAGLVNDATGALSLTHTDLAENGNVMPLSLTRTYNAVHMLEEPEYGIKSGIGWRMNINQSLKWVKLGDKEYCRYIDADGTEHYISARDDSTWWDEDGLGLKLDFHNGDFALTARDGSCARFTEVNEKIYLYALEDGNGNRIDVHYDSGNYDKPDRITDGAKRTTKLGYNSDGRLATVTDAAGRITRYEYDGGDRDYLGKIIYPDGEYTRFSYITGTPEKEVEIICSDGSRLLYNLNPSKMVTNASVKGTDGTTRQLYSVSYPARNVVRYSYSNGLTEDYQSDDFGRVISITNSEGYGAYCGYTKSEGNKPSNNRTSFVSQVQKSVANYAINGNAEGNNGDWDDEGWGDYSGVSVGKNADAKLGNYSWKVTKGSADGYYHKRSAFDVELNKTYTLSGYIKCSLSSYGEGGAALYVMYKDNNGEFIRVNSETVAETKGEWQRVSVTFTNTSYWDHIYIFAGITPGASGTALFDCIQLEDGDTANRYNAVENGNFERGFENVTTTGNVSLAQGGVAAAGGNTAARVQGNHKTGDAGVSIDAKLNVPADTNVVISAYARASAVPMDSEKDSKTNGELTGNPRLFGLQAVIHYTDGSTYTRAVKFNDSLDSGSWQYLSSAINLSYQGDRKCGKTVSYVSVSPRYNSQSNYAEFDMLSLYVEEFGTEYVYDENGKLISSADSAEQNQSYMYGDNNLKQLISPNGSSYQYGYDGHHRLTDSISAEGVRNIIKYDSFGNPVSTLTQGENRNKPVAGEKLYLIKNALTGKYLEALRSGSYNGTRVVQNSLSKTSNQIWKTVQNNDGSFTLSPLSSKNMYLGTENSDTSTGTWAVLSNWKNEGTSFKIERTESGTYNIRLNKDREKLIGIHNSHGTDEITATVKEISGSQGALEQQWYFEEVSQYDMYYSPKDGDTVYIYNLYSGKVLKVTDDNDSENEYVYQYENSKTAGTEWTLKSTGDGWYYLVSGCSENGRVLGFPNGCDNRQEAMIMTNNGSDNVKFKLSRENGGSYRLICKAGENGTALGLDGMDGNEVYIIHDTYNGSDGMKWYFKKTDTLYTSAYLYNDYIYYIKSPANGRYLECTATEAGQNIGQNIFTGENKQKFIVKRSGDSTRIIPVGLSASGLETAIGSSGKMVTAPAASENGGYYYKAERNSNGTYKISSAKNPGTYLRLTNGTTYENEVPYGGTYNGNVYDQWIFEYAGEYIESKAEYTSDGNYLTKVTGSDGSSTSYNYDTKRGNLLSLTEPGNVTTNYTYETSNDQLTKVKQSTSSVSYEYSHRQLKTIVSSSGTKYSFGYNGFSQCIFTKVGERTLSTNIYDSMGRLTDTTYGNGTKVSKSYDEMSRTKSVSCNGTEKVKYTYDNDGNISLIDDKFSGIISSFRYDSIKRPVSMTASNGYSLKMRYDDKNRIKSISENSGSGDKVTEYSYDNTGIISTVKSTYNKNSIYSYYNYDSLMRAEDRYIEINGDEVIYNMWYYKEGNLPGSTTSLVSRMNVNSRYYEYEYDQRGNITKITKNGTVEAQYSYDSFDRLVSETRGGVTTTWTYDTNGNIITRTSGGTKVNYGYGDGSWRDLLTSCNGQEIAYDAIGNPLVWGNKKFTWEAGRRLSSMTLPGKNLSFTYSADGYRTSKTVNGVTTTYYLDGGRISALKKGTDELSFVYDENGSVTGFYHNGTPYVYAKNLQGDIIGIVDAKGAWSVSYEYDAWGKLLSTTGSLAETLGVLNPFRYREYVYDDESGLYYLNSRYYDPEVGRFINADGALAGVGGDVQGYNLFAYCFNNPVMYSDSSGNWPVWAAVVAVVNFFVTVTVVSGITRACIKNCQASNVEPDYAAVDALLKERKVEVEKEKKNKKDNKSDNNVHLPVDSQALLYNKKNRQYASEIIKKDLGEDTKRTVEDISAEIFAHQFVADIVQPFQIISSYLPDKYDIYGRLSQADINEKEEHIKLFNFIEGVFEWE